MTSLSTKVKGLRNVKGLSLTELSKLVPMHVSYLSQVEHGKEANLGRRFLRGLSKALDVRIDYLDDDSIVDNRSWEKLAADESLEVFIKKNDLSNAEIASLRRVSFRQSAPRTLKGWEQFWSNLKTYYQSKNRQLSPKSTFRLHKNINPQKPLG